MCRDQNGYTALLKAAALGRMGMVRALVEAGVDPRHIDPFGNTAREKAELYAHSEIASFLKEAELRAKRGEMVVKCFDIYRRSGKNRCFLDF